MPKKSTTDVAPSPAVKVLVSAPKFATAEFSIRGTAPLVICKFSEEARRMMEEKQAEGDKKAAGKKTRPPKDFEKLYHQARHVATDGWDGIHAGAFRNGLKDACRLTSLNMTMAKLCIFIEPDGWDVEDGTPLVRIIGEPQIHKSTGRNASGGPDIRVRAAYYPWSAKLRIKWDSEVFGITDVTNLLTRVGSQVGVGCGRPFSTDSVGCGWGTFEVEG